MLIQRLVLLFIALGKNHLLVKLLRLWLASSFGSNLVCKLGFDMHGLLRVAYSFLAHIKYVYIQVMKISLY